MTDLAGPFRYAVACIAVFCASCVLWWCRLWQQLQAALPWTGAAQAKQLQASIQELWERHSSDDLVSMFLVLIDAYVTKVSPPATARTPQSCPSSKAQAILWCWLLAFNLHPKEARGI